MDDTGGLSQQVRQVICLAGLGLGAVGFAYSYLVHLRASTRHRRILCGVAGALAAVLLVFGLRTFKGDTSLYVYGFWGGCAALAAAAAFAMLPELRRFLGAVMTEMRKVVWPTREETHSFTLVVLVAVVFVAAYVGILDFIFTKLVAGLKIYQ
ncbi:MAG: preprotein translocase subunit SecE [Armatimonadota bacterium]|jgi:preprotein translocase subunit SecE